MQIFPEDIVSDNKGRWKRKSVHMLRNGWVEERIMVILLLHIFLDTSHVTPKDLAHQRNHINQLMGVVFVFSADYIASRNPRANRREIP